MHVSKHSCVCGVCSMCNVCVCGGVCVRAVWCVCVWDVRFVFWCLWCLCCVCPVWCVLCVARLGTRKTPVCRFKTSPCVGSKRAHVEHMRAFCTYTRKLFEPTRENVLNLHTGVSLSLLSLSLVLSSFSLPSFSSFVLISFSHSALFSLVFPLSNDDSDHSSSRLSL